MSRRATRRLLARMWAAAGLSTAIALIAASGCDVMSPSSLPAIDNVGSEATLTGAGDIGLCGSAEAEATARLLDDLPGVVFTAGDNAYPSGTAENFQRCYEPTWGRHKSRTRPSPGNHEYDSPGARPYFDYFGSNAGPAGLGYYRYRLGAWQVYALNSNVATDPGSEQVQWLRQELGANRSTCALASWHHPLFSSGPNGDTPAVRPLWRELYDAGADVVIVGHDHFYERSAPQDPDGRLDPVRGLRQFMAGTGGTHLTQPVRAYPNSEARWSVHGVLQLVLRADNYTWRFLSASGATTDLGGALCH